MLFTIIVCLATSLLTSLTVLCSLAYLLHPRKSVPVTLTVKDKTKGTPDNPKPTKAPPKKEPFNGGIVERISVDGERVWFWENNNPPADYTFRIAKKF